MLPDDYVFEKAGGKGIKGNFKR
jgi:hypothetical protein